MTNDHVILLSVMVFTSEEDTPPDKQFFYTSTATAAIEKVPSSTSETDIEKNVKKCKQRRPPETAPTIAKASAASRKNQKGETDPDLIQTYEEYTTALKVPCSTSATDIKDVAKKFPQRKTSNIASKIATSSAASRKNQKGGSNPDLIQTYEEYSTTLKQATDTNYKETSRKTPVPTGFGTTKRDFAAEYVESSEKSTSKKQRTFRKPQAKLEQKRISIRNRVQNYSEFETSLAPKSTGKKTDLGVDSEKQRKMVTRSKTRNQPPKSYGLETHEKIYAGKRRWKGPSKEQLMLSTCSESETELDVLHNTKKVTGYTKQKLSDSDNDFNLAPKRKKSIKSHKKSKGAAVQRYFSFGALLKREDALQRKEDRKNETKKSKQRKKTSSKPQLTPDFIK